MRARRDLPVDKTGMLPTRIRLPILAAALALAALPGCALFQSIAGAAFEHPQLTFESWSAEGLDLDGVTIALRYRLLNPNGFGLDVQRLGYRLEVEGRQVAEGRLPAGLHLAPKATSELAIPVRLRWRDLPGFVETLLTKAEVGYRISGEAGVGSPVCGAAEATISSQASGVSAILTTELRADNKLWYLVQSGSYSVWSEASSSPPSNTSNTASSSSSTPSSSTARSSPSSSRPSASGSASASRAVAKPSAKRLW